MAESLKEEKQYQKHFLETDMDVKSNVLASIKLVK